MLSAIHRGRYGRQVIETDRHLSRIKDDSLESGKNRANWMEETMAHIVVLGAGLGGTIMAYEMREKLRASDTLTVINQGTTYSFVPSNPWVAVGWRDRDDITVDLSTVFARRKIALRPEGARKVLPKENRVELNDGSFVDYDYLIIATGPDLAFDEVPGLGPDGYTQSVCHIDHAMAARPNFDALVKKPGPVIVGAIQGASCYGPAYEFAFILDTALRRAKVRDQVPMTFVTPEPYVGHLGLDGVGAPSRCSKAPCATVTSSGSPMPR